MMFLRTCRKWTSCFFCHRDFTTALPPSVGSRQDRSQTPTARQHPVWILCMQPQCCRHVRAHQARTYLLCCCVHSSAQLALKQAHLPQLHTRPPCCLPQRQE